MGKDNLLLGTARGKLGDVVFYRTGGEQRFRTRVKPTNRRTNAQLLQRVVVATAVKAYSNLVEVCNHAFQNFEGSLKNQERYMRLNIKMLREVALQNIQSWSPIKFSSNNYGNWVGKDATITVVNPYIISEGDLPSIETAFKDIGTTTGAIFIKSLESSVLSGTYQEVADNLGLQAGDQLTFVMQRCLTNGVTIQTQIARVILMPSTGQMSNNMFEQIEENKFTIHNPNKENYGELYFGGVDGDAVNSQDVYVYPQGWNAGWVNAFGVIVSRYENNMWRRSNTQMIVDEIDQNVASIQSAMNSYLMAETSSLYLNQAQRTDQLGNPVVYSLQQAEAQAIAMEQEEEAEETSKKTRRKREE